MPITLSQFAKDPLPENLRSNAVETLALINEVSSKIPALKFSSGYRSVERNRRVGGVLNSKHVQAHAADFVTKNHKYSPALVELFKSIAEPKGFNAYVHNAGTGLHIHSEYRGGSKSVSPVVTGGWLLVGAAALAFIFFGNK